jgi:NADH:ubiquinone oxidoreductase subunit 3 (subunit A)
MKWYEERFELDYFIYFILFIILVINIVVLTRVTMVLDNQESIIKELKDKGIIDKE